MNIRHKVHRLAAYTIYVCQLVIPRKSYHLGFYNHAELNELAAIVAQTSFWSAILHTQNYDVNRFMKELQNMGEYMSKNKK